MHTRTPIHTHRNIKRSRIQCQAGAETMRHDKSIFQSPREVFTQKILEMSSHRAGENWRERQRKGDRGRGRERKVYTHLSCPFWAHTHSFFGICLVVVSGNFDKRTPVFGLIIATVAAAVSATALQHSHCVRYRIPIRMSNSKWTHSSSSSSNPITVLRLRLHVWYPAIGCDFRCKFHVFISASTDRQENIFYLLCLVL